MVREHSGYGKRIFSKSVSLERILFVLIPILASKIQFQRTTIEAGPPIRLNRVNTTREDSLQPRPQGFSLFKGKALGTRFDSLFCGQL